MFCPRSNSNENSVSPLEGIVRVLLSSTSSMSVRQSLLLGGEAGLRMSEIPALHWGDFDMKDARSIVVAQRTREDDEELPAQSWQSRTAPLARRLAAVVRDRPRHLRDPHLFLDRGAHLTRQQIRTRGNTTATLRGVKRKPPRRSPCEAV